jgi:hypothetical protein
MMSLTEQLFRRSSYDLTVISTKYHFIRLVRQTTFKFRLVDIALWPERKI